MTVKELRIELEKLEKQGFEDQNVYLDISKHGSLVYDIHLKNFHIEIVAY